MKEFDLKEWLQQQEWLQYFEQYRFELIVGGIIALAFLSLALAIYLMLRKGKSPEAAKGEISREQRKPAKAPVAPAAESAWPGLPEDSVLRRHYLTHVRYMIETVTFPRPTCSVQLRHYNHLIASALEACLGDEGNMQKLVRQYEEFRGNSLR